MHFFAPYFLAMMVLALQSGDYHALKEGGSQFCLAFVVNFVVVWSSPDLPLNCSILSVLAAAGSYRAINSSFYGAA